MKIAGYINYGYRPPAPFVTASILLKELNLKARLPLLVDTGASNTIIMWRDVERLGIDVSKLKPERVYTEVKRVNMRLESLERALETLMDMVLPEEEISEEEWKEITEIEEEIEKGKSVSLEEVRKKHGAN